MRRLLFLVALSGSACTPAVQRASVTPALVQVATLPSEIAATHPDARRFAFRSPHARVHVLTSDLINGDHHLQFRAVRGTLWMERATGRGHLHVDITMHRFEAESAFITDFAASMMEVYRYPHTILEANVEPIDGEPTKRRVTGNMHLHGVERGITFDADVVDHEAGLRLRAVFDMSRGAFNIHAKAEEGEGIIRDDFTVTFDFRAQPERVVAEEEEK